MKASEDKLTKNVMQKGIRKIPSENFNDRVIHQMELKRKEKVLKPEGNQSLPSKAALGGGKSAATTLQAAPLADGIDGFAATEEFREQVEVIKLFFAADDREFALRVLKLLIGEFVFKIARE